MEAFVRHVVQRLGPKTAAQAGTGHVQRTLGDNVDRGTDAARRDRGAAGLVDLQALHAFGGEVVEIERAAGGAAEVHVLVAADGVDESGGDLAAVHGDKVKRRAKPAHGNLRAFAIDAADRHTGNALQRFGQVGIGKLADILGRDGINHAALVALDVHRILEAGAHAGHHDHVIVVGVLRHGGHGGTQCEHGHTHRQHRAAIAANHAATSQGTGGSRHDIPLLMRGPGGRPFLLR